MTTETIDLARRAVACDGWRLMRGMTLTDGELIVLVTQQLFHDGDEQLPTGYWETEPIEGEMLPRSPHLIYEDDEWWPVLDDAATRGCLLEMVREACTPVAFREAVGFCFGNHVRGRRSMMYDPGIVVEYLVAALEAGER